MLLKQVTYSPSQMGNKEKIRMYQVLALVNDETKSKKHGKWFFMDIPVHVQFGVFTVRKI